MHEVTEMFEIWWFETKLKTITKHEEELFKDYVNDHENSDFAVLFLL